MRRVPIIENSFGECQTIKANTLPGTDEVTQIFWILLGQEQEEKEEILKEAWGKMGNWSRGLKMETYIYCLNKNWDVINDVFMAMFGLCLMMGWGGIINMSNM